MKKILMLTAFPASYFLSHAQMKLGGNPGNLNNSAVLELESSNKGLLLPRMTNAERSAISSPATGLVVYNTTLACVEMYNGSQWGCLGFTASPLLGSAITLSNGTDPFSANTTCTSAVISAQHTAATCQPVTTTQGNTYQVTLINGQCWMKANLRDTPSNYAYNNTWLNDLNFGPDTARYGYYHTTVALGGAGFQASEPAPGEGMLYQWKAAMNGSTAERAQGACPGGWHIPSDCEFMYLEHGLGMSIAHQNSVGGRNSGNVAQDLSSVITGGTNSSGWTALLAGSRSTGLNPGSFNNRGTYGYWYTSTISSDFDTPISRSMNLGSADPGRFTYTDPAMGRSVRCLKD